MHGGVHNLRAEVEVKMVLLVTTVLLGMRMWVIQQMRPCIFPFRALILYVTTNINLNFTNYFEGLHIFLPLLTVKVLGEILVLQILTINGDLGFLS